MIFRFLIESKTSKIFFIHRHTNQPQQRIMEPLACLRIDGSLLVVVVSTVKMKSNTFYITVSTGSKRFWKEPATS
ncbi:MAG: hypothetical protein OJF59_000788 [Cytophagales bacterium]|jgi:hypothetical protein|nr:MAG: hypothetical protein OJF59_000788 [Cytophagales bacterium]